MAVCRPVAFALALAMSLGCGGHMHTHGVAETKAASASSSKSTENADAALAAMLAEHDRAEDATISAWYDPQLLMGNMRPDVLRGLEATTGPLGELTLYDFDLDIAPGTASFRLEERVYFENHSTEALTDLMFRVYANTPAPGEPLEKLVHGHCVQAACTVEAPGRDVIVVHPAQPIAPGARFRLVLHLMGTLEPISATQTTMMAAAQSSLKTMTSGGSGDYGLLAVGDDILSFANFYPVLARHVGNDWDLDQGTMGDIGPDALSHVRAHVEVPSGYTVAASGIVTRAEEAGGRRRIDYAAGCMRDFALLTSNAFTSVERAEGDVKVRSYFRTSDRATGEKVLDVAAWALKDFQKRFGPYPYRELDIVEQALIGGAGGVEFAGLATVASMFYKPSGDAAGGAGFDAMLAKLLGNGGDDGMMKASASEFTTAHEVGHQWWHGVVGSDSRKHPWQDEALAQFSAMLYTEDRYGATRAKREADMNARMSYEMMRLMGQPDGPVDVPAGRQSQIAYGGLVYGKGPYYLVALRKQLGDAAFFAAMQSYVKQYYFGFAPAHALAEAMTHASQKDAAQIAALSHRWLIEAHGDEDLGKASMGSMLTMAGAGGGGANTPDIQQLMKTLGGASGGASDADLLKMLQQQMSP